MLYKDGKYYYLFFDAGMNAGGNPPLWTCYLARSKNLHTGWKSVGKMFQGSSVDPSPYDDATGWDSIGLGMLGMDQVHVIRDKVLREGKSIRRTARELGLSRNTVVRYLAGDVEPPRYRLGHRAAPVLDAVVPRMQALLDQWAKRTTHKQRVTASRLHVLRHSPDPPGLSRGDGHRRSA